MMVFGYPLRPQTMGTPARDPEEMNPREIRSELDVLRDVHERLEQTLELAVAEHKRRAAVAADAAEQHRQAVMSGPTMTYAGQTSRTWDADSEYRAERAERDRQDAAKAANDQGQLVADLRSRLGAIAVRQAALSARLDSVRWA